MSVVLMSCELCHGPLRTLEEVGLHRCDQCRRLCDVCDRELPDNVEDAGRHPICARVAAACESELERLSQAGRVVRAIERVMSR